MNKSSSHGPSTPRPKQVTGKATASTPGAEDESPEEAARSTGKAAASAPAKNSGKKRAGKS